MGPHLSHGISLLRSPRRVAPVLAAALLGLAASSLAHADISFSDNFTASNINTVAGTPTATSTTYQIGSSKNATSSIPAGHLIVNMPSTTSGVTEAQARFSAAPITLASAGDYVEFAMTFTPSNILASGTADTLYFGLFNTGGTAPLSGLQTSGFNTTAASAFATGGSQMWQGYNSAINVTTAKFLSRPQQAGVNTTSANQEVLANGASGGTYNNPNGTQVTPTLTQASNLTSALAYTEFLRITLNGDGSETLSSNLYQGIDNTGANLVSQSATTSITPLTSSFDGLAFGWRHSITPGTATSMDVTALSVSTGNTAPAPEPTSLSLLALGALSLLARRRHL